MKIGIAVVDYGNPEYLKECLHSLNIDNSEVFDSRIFDCNIQNIGFTAANNNLIKDYLSFKPGWQPDWIWLLNNDTIVPADTIQSIIDKLPEIEVSATINKNGVSDFGIVGFQIRSIENPDLIHHAGTQQCFPAGIHKSGSVKFNQFNVRTFERWVTFASVLIRREVFETIGLLDETFFNICSDSDFCYRARAAGFKVIYEPSFMIYHHIGQSQTPSPEMQEIHQRDIANFQNKWLNGKLYFDLDHELMGN